MSSELELAYIRKYYPHWKPTSKYKPEAQIHALYSRMIESKQVKGQTKIKEFLPQEPKYIQLCLFD